MLCERKSVGTQAFRSLFDIMLMYSDDIGVDGLAVLPQVDEYTSGPDEVAEDAKDCRRCAPGASGEVSSVMKLDDIDGQLDDEDGQLDKAAKDAKSSSWNSCFGVNCISVVVSAILAMYVPLTVEETRRCLVSVSKSAGHHKRKTQRTKYLATQCYRLSNVQSSWS